MGQRPECLFMLLEHHNKKRSHSNDTLTSPPVRRGRGFTSQRSNVRSQTTTGEIKASKTSRVALLRHKQWEVGDTGDRLGPSRHRRCVAYVNDGIYDLVLPLPPPLISRQGLCWKTIVNFSIVYCLPAQAPLPQNLISLQLCSLHHTVYVDDGITGLVKHRQVCEYNVVYFMHETIHNFHLGNDIYLTGFFIFYQGWKGARYLHTVPVLPASH